VITVGAFNTRGTDTTSDDVMTSYSSKGPSLLDHVIKPDLVAPGNKIVSLLANGSTLDKKAPSNEVSPSLYNSRATKASYFILSGTSMSTAIVSGAVALMLQYQSNLSPDQVKARLMKNASKTYPSNSTVTSNGTKYNIQDDIFTVGAGYLDTYDAMNSNDFPSGTALSPIAVRDHSGNVLFQADPSSIWSNSITWDDSIVWGNSVLLSGSSVSGSSIIWGNSVVWGNSTMSGNSIVWETSIIWSTSTTYSEAFNSDDN
jgi:serine protease AprX